MTGVLSFLRNAQNEGRLKFYENQPLSSLSSFGIGGPAALTVYPQTVETLKQTAMAAYADGMRSIVIGNASNLLFDDLGFDGMVISCTALKKIIYPFKDDADKTSGYVYAECGASLPVFVNLLCRAGVTGFEGLCSVPATIGGAVRSNAGAFGCEIADKLFSFEVYQPSSGSTVTRYRRDTHFAYRESGALKTGEVLLSAVFHADKGDADEIFKRLREARQKRLVSQPQGVRSAGSYFKRPDASQGLEPYRGLSAGELIDRCALKGFSVGNAAVSEKHANFLINKGGAACRDVLTLADIIKNTVYDFTGVELCEEVRYIPYHSD